VTQEKEKFDLQNLRNVPRPNLREKIVLPSSDAKNEQRKVSQHITCIVVGKLILLFQGKKKTDFQVKREGGKKKGEGGQHVKIPKILQRFTESDVRHPSIPR